jgi:ATP-dependent Clp protease ATP-binding subunit ClpA
MYGARPIRRWVQKNVVTKLSKLLVGGEIGEGSTIHIDAKDHKVLKYGVVKKASAEPPRKQKRQKHGRDETGETKRTKKLP